MVPEGAPAGGIQVHTRGSFSTIVGGPDALSVNSNSEDVADALAAGRIRLPPGSSVTRSARPFGGPDERVTATAISVPPLVFSVEEAVKLGLITPSLDFQRHVYEGLVAAMPDKVDGWRRWQYGIGEG